ncbi:molybdopterin cofactor-binding domain-containing protein [Ekhidna sp.]|uniref:molybdopterin cofactor-binding domain-containing protein n=1 Tax=Ekhidna sp. TaxID=2608089 RepID=UPI003B502949
MTLIRTQINRRSFMKLSAAAGGGMMLGFSWLASCSSPKEEYAQIPEEWFDINAFIKIGENGTVTIYSPNPEIGQNVKTSMPVIVAEELDIDWKNVIVEQADLNTVKYNRQLAGGSQSIRHGWQSLRMAGATGRRMMMEAAAKQWEVPVSELTTSMGEVIHAASDKKIGYGALASLAATLEIPAEVELKDNADFKLIGGNIKNVDAKKIVTGEPLFGLDYEQEGMLTAMIVHPPAFGMKMTSFDASETKSMPGIKDVIVVNTEPKEKQWSDTNAFTELIAVVGESTWQVMKAKKALKVEWEQDTPAENSEDHVRLLTEAMDKPGEEIRKDGDPENASKNASNVVESIYSAPFLAHNTMEPMNFFANVTADKAELVGPIQTPEYLRLSAMDLLGMTEDQVSIQMTRMGGGFGRRLYGNFGLEAAAISQKMQAPIKLVYTREDDMTQGTYRPAYRVAYKAALDVNGDVLSWQVKGAGIPSDPLFPNRFPAGTIDNFKIERVRIPTNISTGAWRAPRSNFIAGAEQSFIDEVAEAAGKDPIEFRLNLFDRAMKDPVGEVNDYDAERYAGVLKLVREKSNWGTEMPGVFRGVSAYYCHNSYVAQVVDLEKKDNDLKIKKVWCAVDCGIVVNVEGALNQIQGGIIDGIGHAMYSTLTFKDGKPQQENFNGYRLIRNSEAPLEIETHFVENGIDPTGLGEPSLPPISAALANALYQATGQRYYHQPFSSAEQVQVEMVG